MKRLRRYGVTLLATASLVTIVLLATGWGSALAAQVSNVLVTNTGASQAVPVHEQGTANVNVTNTDLSVAEPAPIAGGGSNVDIGAGSTTSSFPKATATALVVDLSAGVSELLLSTGGQTAATFIGPSFGGNGHVVLALTRPITFTTVECDGSGGGCAVSWIGDSP